jgi:hypothetical protein
LFSFHGVVVEKGKIGEGEHLNEIDELFFGALFVHYLDYAVIEQFGVVLEEDVLLQKLRRNL